MKTMLVRLIAPVVALSVFGGCSSENKPAAGPSGSAAAHGTGDHKHAGHGAGPHEGTIADQARVHGVPESEVVGRILLTQNAKKRLIEPSEVGKYAAFLCRDEAWSITGTAVTMDAGWLAH